MLLLLGLFGLAVGLWLIHREYVAGRIHANYAEHISDGRVSQEIYARESLLAWRDVAFHLGVLGTAASFTFFGFRRLGRKPTKAR
jgi:hypothetical protein